MLLIVNALCLMQSFAAPKSIMPVDITVQLVPPYTSRIVDYVAPGNEKLRIIALQRDLTQASYRFFLRMEVSVNGQVLFRTNRNWMPPPTTIAPGVPVILSGADLQPYFDVNRLDFVNFSRDQYIANPNLPEGYTSICFTAYDYGRPDVAVSETNCGNYFLTLPEPPMLNYPACGMQVRALSPQQVIFSWVPMNMGNTAAQSTVYEMSLYENRDHRNPNDIVQNIAPVYTNRTPASTLIYGPGEPALQTGMSYVWRVQAIDENKRQAFKNNGFSQPCQFTYNNDSGYNWNNAQPLQIYALAMNETNAKIGWQPDKDISYDRYTVYYRKKGDDNNWFNNTLTDTTYFLSGLEPNTSYETRVQGIKGASSGLYSNIAGFTTPPKKVVDCKQAAGILATYNGRPYLKAMHGDIVHYGSFDLTLDRVQSLQPGYYSGTGTVTIPFMAGMVLSVSFSNIQIDDDMQVTAGEVVFDTEGVNAWEAETPTANTVIKNLSDALKQLLNSKVQDDSASWTALENKIVQLAQNELPQVLLDSFNTALQQMNDARIAYGAAKQAYDSATTDDAKQDAKNKMDTAEKQFNDGKQAVDTLTKEKDKLVKDVADIIIKALKELNQESNEVYKTDEDAKNKKDLSNEIYDKQNITGQLAGTVIIGHITAVDLSDDDLTDEMKQYNSKAGMYLQSATKGKVSKITTAMNNFYKDTSAIANFFAQDQALSGGSIIKLIVNEKQNGKTDKELIVLAKQEMVKRIQLIIDNEQ
jgi:hypothetical protein